MVIKNFKHVNLSISLFVASLVNLISVPVFADPPGRGIHAPGACNSVTGTYNTGLLAGVPCDKPITDMESLLVIAKNMIANFVLPAVGTIFLIMFIWGAITYISSAGMPERIKKGKDILLASIVGLFIVITAEVLIGVLATVVGGGVR